MESNNLSTTIANTINELIQNLFSSIDNNIYSYIDDIIFLNTDVLSNGIKTMPPQKIDMYPYFKERS